MNRKKQILLIFIVFLLVNGCQDKEEVLAGDRIFYFAGECTQISIYNGEWPPVWTETIVKDTIELIVNQQELTLKGKCIDATFAAGKSPGSERQSTYISAGGGDHEIYYNHFKDSLICSSTMGNYFRSEEYFKGKQL
jgi:hypothetical protein